MFLELDVFLEVVWSAQTAALPRCKCQNLSAEQALCMISCKHKSLFQAYNEYILLK